MKWILVAIVVVSSVLADLLQSHEMKIGAATKGERFGLMSILKAIGTRPNLILAIACMTIPASAPTFVLETILARVVLKERIDSRRAAGALLVVGGVFLLG
jgi:hypothetical protein